ncbi:MAG: beta-mannosidase [Nocardioides sp.]|nr:beta-mannosidase [Nocardioides sp.]
MTVIREPVVSWTIQATGPVVPAEVAAAGAIPAVVPGSVHTDLMSAGLIDDPFLDENEKLQSWIGQTDWTYQGSFSWQPDGGRHALVFGGIDTIASIRLNGDDLAVTRNMHRTYRFDVTELLVPGRNVVEVAISSPVKEADSASLSLGYRPHTNHHPYNAIRKMACGFGWDWGIDLSTSALWRPVVLESWATARLDVVRVAGDVVAGVPTLRAAVACEQVEEDESLWLDVRIGEHTRSVPVLAGVASVDLPIPDAHLWWPRGYGEPALYDALVTLRDGSDVLDESRKRVGFRSVSVRTEPDGDGVGFAIVVNGRDIHVRGANWIPDDAFLHRVDRARYARRMEQAEFAGVNLIRVWGGGIYESDDFYSECDARGILTWQDFLLACAAYAEEEPLWSEFEAEAREAITRIGAHPSIVVFNGNNENIWGHQDWNWNKRLEGRTWGSGYYYDLFPRLVAELAPHVPYTPGSPFTPDREAYQNDPHAGTVHIWDLWNSRDWPDYRDYRPRFVAEFGWQGPPTWSTLTRAVTDSPLTPESPGMLVHQKAAKGNDKLTDGLTAHLPLPNDMTDWHWAMSLNQAVAVRTAIEWYRSLAPHCTGTIVWQLNDCWPVTSWSAVDGDERAKPLLYALRQAHADRLLTIQPTDVGLRVALVNDSLSSWRGELEVERCSFDGQVLASFRHDVEVAAGESVDVEVPIETSTAGDCASELLIARIGDVRAFWFYAEYRDSALEPAHLGVESIADGDDWLVTVMADTLTRDVALLVDRVVPDAFANVALETLLPGESLTIRVTGAAGVDPARFAAADVLRSANDLVAGQP